VVAHAVRGEAGVDGQPAGERDAGPLGGVGDDQALGLVVQDQLMTTPV
jgi:hypothetical protein